MANENDSNNLLLNPEEPVFVNFLEGFVQFSKNFSDSAVNIDQNQEVAKLIKFYGDSMTNVTAQVQQELTVMYETMADDERTVVDRHIRLSDGVTLVNSANSLVQGSNVSSRRALGGIGGIIEILKKIIRQVFDILNIRFVWLERLFELIDNILKHLLGLFSRRAATDATPLL